MMDPRAKSAIEQMKVLADYYRSRVRLSRAAVDKRIWSGRACEVEYCMEIVEDAFTKIPLTKAG